MLTILHIRNISTALSADVAVSQSVQEISISIS